jgi:hypothetical protein
VIGTGVMVARIATGEIEDATGKVSPNRAKGARLAEKPVRLTDVFSKKFENHCHALALYFFWTTGPST